MTWHLFNQLTPCQANKLTDMQACTLSGLWVMKAARWKALYEMNGWNTADLSYYQSRLEAETPVKTGMQLRVISNWI